MKRNVLKAVETLGLPIERRCHCGELATYVAADAEGLMWFECGRHERQDNIGGTTRVKLMPLEDWLAYAEVDE